MTKAGSLVPAHSEVKLLCFDVHNSFGKRDKGGLATLREGNDG